MKREITKKNYIDLRLSTTDKQALDQLSAQFESSTQRIMEVALTRAAYVGLSEPSDERYSRDTRIVLRFDGLAMHQLAQLVKTTGLSQQGVLRLAFQGLADNENGELFHA
ncbi:MAG: hypothetical protein AAF639_39390 [Chloroflexota bacterium]